MSQTVTIWGTDRKETAVLTETKETVLINVPEREGRNV